MKYLRFAGRTTHRHLSHSFAKEESYCALPLELAKLHIWPPPYVFHDFPQGAAYCQPTPNYSGLIPVASFRRAG